METCVSQPNKTPYKPHFMLIPSLSCPASCSYCFGPNSGPAMKKDMLGRVIGFMEQIVKETGQRKVSVTLHGGEPLAAGYEVIEALVTGLHDRFKFLDLKIGIQSNLWLLDERLCGLFSKYKVEVGTSLDGPQELNDRQRGSGYYEKTMKAIRLAHYYGINVSCIATFTSYTMPHWKEVFDFFLSENLHFSVHPAIPSIAGGNGLGLTPGQYWNLFKEMFDYYILHRKNIKVSFFDQLCQGVAAYNGKVCTFRDCFGMFLAVDPYGDIYPCQRFAGNQEYRLGNIRESPSMADLSCSSAALKYLARESGVWEKCFKCEHYDYCKGGCTYNSLTLKGESELIDPYCEAYKKIFAYIKQRIHEDMVSEDNIKAISESGPAEKGNPLLRKGPVIELTDEHTHPYYTARTAQKIIAAYELAKGPGIPEAAGRLVKMGICRTEKSGEAILYSLRDNMDPKGALNKLYIHITWNCQLKCTHCYAAHDENKNKEMDIACLEKLIKEGHQCGFQETVITGGEPLLHKERDLLLKTLLSLRQQIKPMKLVLRTNFSMPLAAEDLTLIAKAFDNIAVSVDGGREQHDSRRGAGLYDKVVHNLEMYTSQIEDTIEDGSWRIPAAKIYLAASMKTEQVNSEPGIAVKDLARRLKIRAKFRPLLPLGRALNYDEPIVSEALRSYLPSDELMEAGFTPVLSCGMGQNLYVEPTGEAFPCYAYHRSHSYLGSVIQEGLGAVIKGEPFKVLQGHNVDSNKGCKLCEYRYLCGGACRAWGREAAQNDLDAAPVECTGLRKRAEELHKAALRYLSIDGSD